MSQPIEPIPTTLQYAQPPRELVPTRPRPKWVYVIVALYGLILFALLIVPAAIAVMDSSMQEMAYAAAYVIALVLAGLGMVLVPVRAKRHRPIHRRSIWVTIVASGALFALL